MRKIAHTKVFTAPFFQKSHIQYTYMQTRDPSQDSEESLMIGSQIFVSYSKDFIYCNRWIGQHTHRPA